MDDEHGMAHRARPGDGFARPPLPPVTSAVRCSAGIATTCLGWCVLVLCRGPHRSPLFENILERQYRICLAYGLRDRFLPVLNNFCRPWVKVVWFLIATCVGACARPSGAETDARRPCAGSVASSCQFWALSRLSISAPDSAMPFRCPRAWRSPAIAGRFPASSAGGATAVPGSP